MSCGAPPPASRPWSARSWAACWSTRSGWEWIFFINIPVGILGFVLAWRLVPGARDARAQFDWLGVAAQRRRHVPAGLRHPGGSRSTTGRPSDHRDDRRGARVVVSPCSSAGRRATGREPLVPLELFRDRNFSLANVAIAVDGLRLHGDGLPAHALGPGGPRATRPTEAGTAPGPDGGHVDRARHVRRAGSPTGCTRASSTATGFARWRSSLVLLASRDRPPTPRSGRSCCRWRCWASASRSSGRRSTATANRNLPMHLAGAGAGVYNANRQVGAVLGSAAIAVLMDSRLAANGLGASRPERGSRGGELPAGRTTRSATAMAQRCCCCRRRAACSASLAVLFFERPRHYRRRPARRGARTAGG